MVVLMLVLVRAAADTCWCWCWYALTLVVVVAAWPAPPGAASASRIKTAAQGAWLAFIADLFPKRYDFGSEGRELFRMSETPRSVLGGHGRVGRSGTVEQFMAMSPP